MKKAQTTAKSAGGLKEDGAIAGPSPDWRIERLARIRVLIHQAIPEVVEEVKWRKPSNAMAGVPVWSHEGIICTGETYKNAVKLTFAKGASVPDPSGLFNSSLEGSTRRAIDIREGETINESAFIALVRAAGAANTRTVRNPKKTKERVNGAVKPVH